MSKVMKKIVIGEMTIGIILLVGLGIAGLFLPSAKDDATRFTKVAEKRMPAIVRIVTVHKGRAIGGAGVLISDRGHILTAAHLFPNEEVIPTVTLKTGTTLAAEIIFSHQTDDIALIKIDHFTPFYAPLGRFGSVKIGQEVVAIGHPLSLEWSVTHGIVSQLRMKNKYIQFTQMDAALNPGNSGGAIFNLEGEVIGIASHVYLTHMLGSPSGLNMAVSIDAIHRFLSKFRGV